VNDIPAGTARWRRTADGIKLERFAVLAEFRKKGVASALLETILDDVLLEHPSKIYLHSQIQAVPLYEKYGFEKQGDIFTEAGIEHYKMSYTRKQL
jgi:predicted GNAT family N-acyltransferase